VWLGTGVDAGTDKDLEAVKSAIKRQSGDPSRVDAVLIQQANHVYDGQEQEVADALVAWINSAVPKQWTTA
jgi:hypothetical protein